MRGLAELREAVNGPDPEPSPLEQLADVAKTFGRADVAKRHNGYRGAPLRGVAELREATCPPPLPTPATEQLLDLAKTLRGGPGVTKGPSPDERPAARLSGTQYRQLERALNEWERNVRAGARAYPTRGYRLGVDQTLQFLELLGRPADLPPGGAATQPAAVDWLTQAKVDGALARYVDEIKTAALHGMQGGANPTQVASWLYKATRDAGTSWRVIARTEMARANATGRLDAVAAMGYDKVWIPPHTGSCKDCRRLLEDQVFTVDQLQGATNYGRKQRDWIPALPLHPHCRHIALPYLPDVVDESRRQTQALADHGLNDRALDEMFDSSGQLKPEYENDPRLQAMFAEAGKAIDPLRFAVGRAVAKVTRRWPAHLDGGDEIGKGYFDHPQLQLDPLLWHDSQLQPGIRDRIVKWWRQTLGPDAPLWSHIYLTGGATSLQWATSTVERDPDVDLQLLVDYPALREHHPEYASLSDPELHTALVTRIKEALDDVEVAPGVALDAFIRRETAPEALSADVRRAGQALFDVVQGRWLAPPVPLPDREVVEHGHYLEGLGGEVAAEHPRWVRQARSLATAMEDLLARGDNLTQDDVDELRETYEFVHELRRRAFEGDGGNAGLGNFIWQYLVNYGPLMQVKRLLHDAQATA